MKQVYAQNRSPHIYTKTSPAKSAIQSSKQPAESATFKGMEEQMKTYNLISMKTSRLLNERDHLKKKINEIQSIQTRFKDLDETKENKGYIEKLTKELVANIEEKLEIKQSIKELSEITLNNDKEISSLKNCTRSTPISYAQKIEISEKIEKLSKSNQEMNEIKEKLMSTMHINDQQLSMLKTHIVTIIEEYLYIIFRFETKEIESRYDYCQMKIQNLTLNMENTQKAQKIAESNQKIKELLSKLNENNSKNKLSSTKVNRENSHKKFNNENEAKENFFSTPTASSKKVQTKVAADKRSSEILKLKIMNPHYSQDKSLSPNNCSRDKRLESTQLRIQMSLLGEKSLERINSNPKNVSLVCSGENERKEFVHPEKSDLIITSQFFSDKTDSSINELTPRGFDNNDTRNKKEPKVARIELKNVKNSSYASESSTKLNSDKSKTPSISSRYGNIKNDDIFESKDDMSKLKKKKDIMDSKEVNTFDLLHSLESIKSPKEIEERSDSRFINVADNYDPDNKLVSKKSMKMTTNDSVVIDDDSIMSNYGSEEEITSKSGKLYQSKDIDHETCVIESSVPSTFLLPQNEIQNELHQNHEYHSDFKSMIKESLSGHNPMLASNCDDRVIQKGKEEKLLGSEMRNPLEESALDEVEHLESVNGSPVICKTSKTLFTLIAPQKFNNHSSLCLQEEDL